MQSRDALPSEQQFKGRRSLDELIKKLEHDKSLVMNNDFRETLSHLNENIAYKRIKIAQVLAKVPQAPSTSETQSLSSEAPSSGAQQQFKGRRSLDELIKNLEQDKSLVMNNDFRESHLNENIAYKRIKMAQILAKVPQAPSTSETQSLSSEAPSSAQILAKERQAPSTSETQSLSSEAPSSAQILAKERQAPSISETQSLSSEAPSSAQILAKEPQAPSTSETQSLSSEAPSSGAPSTNSEAPTQAALPEEYEYEFEEVDESLFPTVTISEELINSVKRTLEMRNDGDSELEDSSEEECQLANWIVAGIPTTRAYPDSRFCKKRTKKYIKRQKRVMPKNSQKP